MTLLKNVALSFVTTSKSGFGVRGSGFGVRGSGFGVRGSGFGVRSSGFGVRDEGIRDQGIRDSEFGVREGLSTYRIPNPEPRTPNPDFADGAEGRCHVF